MTEAGALVEARLRRCLRSLPSSSKAATIADEARAVLALVIEPAREPSSGVASSHDPTRCPNCARPVASVRSPYCGDMCREVAGFVRQMRSGLKDETLLDPDRQTALGQVLWRILGGGLPLRNSLIEPKALARLMVKHEGKCAGCGAPATTVDHVGSHCNRPSNLRPMCDACAQTKPFGSAEVLGRPEVGALRAELARRIGSPSPICPCDDAATWDWRAYVAWRRRTLRP